MWLCNCSCGNEKIVPQTCLRNKYLKTKIVSEHNLHYRRAGVKSCGCLLRENGKNMRLPFGEAPFNSLYCRFKKVAKKRGHEWDLSKDQVRQITQQVCHYCGIKPYQKQRNDKRAWDSYYIYNGLDRKDNNRGYIWENVVPCCGICNHHKSNQSIEEFRGWLTRVYRHYIEPIEPEKIIHLNKAIIGKYHTAINT